MKVSAPFLGKSLLYANGFAGGHDKLIRAGYLRQVGLLSLQNLA